MKKYLYFKVKYGFGSTEKVSISEKDLERAIFAQIKGTPVQLGNNTINGKYIISISPDYHKYTGWNEFYEPTDSDDFTQIQRDCPNFDGVLELYKDRVLELMRTNQTQLIGRGQPLQIEYKQKEESANIPESLKLVDKFKI